MTRSSLARLLTSHIMLILISMTICTASTHAEPEHAADLKTQWAQDVDPENPLPEYPRPQLVRADWTNLNGTWSYAVTESDADHPAEWDGAIVVPFCIESALSGVQRTITPEQALWYRRTFESPSRTTSERVILHFGAVDWQATVWVNGQRVGRHQGGYDPFNFDITRLLRDGENELVVRAWDPTDTGVQPRGKQIRDPGGIWYTAVTGIWQTVWLETVPRRHVTTVDFTTNPDRRGTTMTVDASSDDAVEFTYEVRFNDTIAARGRGTTGSPVSISINEPQLWSPDAPNLYDVELTLDGGDRIRTYFGLRTVSVQPDERGVNRLFLNGAPLFQYGPLDQGWWPDGLYTAPTDEALAYDLRMTKELGFNMVRKHVKIEPARWYWWCDRLGLLVWQDMPNGDRHIGPNDPDIERSEESADIYLTELKAMIDDFRHFPSIIMWVPYNEGWGQWKTEDIAAVTADWDPTRLVNATSGWADRNVGDVHDVHRYPGPGMPPTEPHRAVVLGEFGGLGLPVSGHTWQDEKNWGYRSYDSADELLAAYEQLLEQLHELIGRGLAAAVYTQTTDVEIEVNGLLTYDRILKVDAERAAAAAKRLFTPPPRYDSIVSTARDANVQWKYTVEQPGDYWFTDEFDDSDWNTGSGGFGTHGTPGAHIGTTWDTYDIWLRRSVRLARVPESLVMRIHHDESTEVYVNGTLLRAFEGYTTDYIRIRLTDRERELFRRGRNTIAVHCHQTVGGQYIDLGFSRRVK